MNIARTTLVVSSTVAQKFSLRRIRRTVSQGLSIFSRNSLNFSAQFRFSRVHVFSFSQLVLLISKAIDAFLCANSHSRSFVHSFNHHRSRLMYKGIREFFSWYAGTAVSVGIFSHILKIDDAIVGIMSCTSKILASFVYAFAATDWMVYVGQSF